MSIEARLIDFLSVGSEVFSYEHGSGTVIGIEVDSQFPISVEYPTEEGPIKRRYTADGNIYQNLQKRPSLFLEAWEPSVPALPKIRPVKIGEFGRFWDNDPRGSVFGYLQNFNPSATSPYVRHVSSWKNFEQCEKPTWFEAAEASEDD